MGQGAMTGRGAGFCSGNDGAGFESAPRRGGFGGGFGRRGGGRGRGFRNRADAPGFQGRRGVATQPGTVDDVGLIRQQLDRLQTMMNDLRAQLDKLVPHSED